MTRRHLAVLVAVVLAVAVCLAAVVGTRGSGARATEAGRTASAERPNIVFITTDDQTLAEMAYLPKTRRLLGGAGATFTRFLAPQPLCCPSRAQMLTGQYAQNNDVRNNGGRHGGYDQFHPETALPTWLQAAGYRTGFTGKYLNLYDETDGIETGWDSWNPTVDNIYQYRDYTQYDNGELVEPAEYHTDYVATQTRDLIDDFGSGADPFFVWASFVAPHGTCPPVNLEDCSLPPRPAEQYAGLYPDVRLPVLDDPSFNERGVKDKPRFVTEGGKVDPAEMQTLYTQRLRALASVDDAVESIVGELEATGHLDDTMVVFTSDNGYLFGQHRYTGKILGYEESVRVPLLIRGPGVPAGVRRAQTGTMIDLAPTFAALAGARATIPVDGRSLLPYARDDRRQADRTVLLQAGARGPDRRNLGWLFRGVRTDHYTFIRWAGSGFTELYDRRRDPYELRSVTKRAAYAEIRAELTRRTRALASCSGDSCRKRFAPLP